MPDVTGERLDLAYSDLSAAGVDKSEVEIVGGGTFGVISESNWTVCEQRPAAGATPESVRLVVDRECANTDTADASEGETGTTSEDTAEGTSESGGSATGAFKMPDVVGMVLQDAQDLLQSKGSYVMDQVDDTGLGRFQVLDSNWKVCSQKPKPGAKVKDTTMVTLGAVKLDEDCP